MNTVNLTGRLVSDPELRQTTSGISVCKVTVAVDRETSAKEADFIRVVLFRQSADFLCKYCKKADVVGVIGRIRTSSYDDKDGRKVYTTEVYADRVERLHEHKAKADYPNNGTSLPIGDVLKEEGNDEGNDDGDDLPF
jgi:single-strand DNA-binding protein